jgi:Xaa-Pro aminopeptidase
MFLAVFSDHARSIKNENEVIALRCAIHACERAVDEMRRAVVPGVTENDVWAVLHAWQY